MTTSTEFDAPEGDVEGSDKKKLVVAGGVVVALLLGFGGYTLLSGGDSTEEALVIPKGTPKVAPAKLAAKPVAKPAVKSVVPAATAVKLGRDPFLARYTVPPPPPPAPVATADTTTSTAGSTSGTGTSGSAPSSTASAPYALTLKSIGTSGEVKTYTFSVDGQSKTVIPAQKFGKYGELVVLAYVKNSKGDPIGALIQVGDDDPVGIKVGEKLTVL